MAGGAVLHDRGVVRRTSSALAHLGALAVATVVAAAMPAIATIGIGFCSIWGAVCDTDAQQAKFVSTLAVVGLVFLGGLLAAFVSWRRSPYLTSGASIVLVGLGMASATWAAHLKDPHDTGERWWTAIGLTVAVAGVVVATRHRRSLDNHRPSCSGPTV